MRIEEITGLKNCTVEKAGDVVTVYSNGVPAPDAVQRWYRACLAAGKELPFDAVELLPSVIGGLAALGITVESAEDLRGKMPQAVGAMNGAYESASSDSERIAILRSSVNLLAAYVGVIGRNY